MSAIAYFISPHGFGHATRAAAVMGAIQRFAPQTTFEIYTQVPEWLFQASLNGGFTYHNLHSDIGLVQKSPLEEDLDATLQRLADFIPFDEALLSRLAGQVLQSGCRLVVCDIAPLGIAVAHRAGLPAVLVENFTWDWIYAGYLEAEPRFAPYIAYLGQVFRSATVHIQTEPVSLRLPTADLVTSPVSRAWRTPPQVTRQRLVIPASAHLVLVTMGGIKSPLAFASHPGMPTDLYFVIPGAGPQAETLPNCVCLPYHSDYYHPDLVIASDVIVGKAGYSTLAEAYTAGAPFVYVSRPLFRETQSLTAFIQQELGGFEISEADFLRGTWIPSLVHLLQKPRRSSPPENGADQVARFILQSSAL